MRYTAKLVPSGRIVRDPNMAVRLRRAASPAETPVVEDALPGILEQGTRVQLIGSGTLLLPVGIRLLVTMIGAGAPGGSWGGGGNSYYNNPVDGMGADTSAGYGGGIGGPGGGAGMYIRKWPYTVDRPISYSVATSSTQGWPTYSSDTRFGPLVALGARYVFIGSYGNFVVSVGGGNTATNGDGASAFWFNDHTLAGANGGRGGNSYDDFYGTAGPAQSGGTCIFTDPISSDPPSSHPGGAGGKLITSFHTFGAGGGGAASPFGAGGNGGNFDSIPLPGAGTKVWGAGGGGSADWNALGYALGGRGGSGAIFIELDPA